jgi:hypothetical protein
MEHEPMSIIEKIIAKTKPEKKLGPGDLANVKLQEQLTRLRAEGAERGRLAAVESKLAADDEQHYAEHRLAFVRREQPSDSALAVYDANQAVELAQRVIARTKPQPVHLNDGSFGPHPSVTKLAVVKAALRRAIERHERLQQARVTPMSSINAAPFNTNDYLKGTK